MWVVMSQGEVLVSNDTDSGIPQEDRRSTQMLAFVLNRCVLTGGCQDNR
jgi:hypothetical protein